MPSGGFTSIVLDKSASLAVLIISHVCEHQPWPKSQPGVQSMAINTHINVTWCDLLYLLFVILSFVTKLSVICIPQKIQMKSKVKRQKCESRQKRAKADQQKRTLHINIYIR